MAHAKVTLGTLLLSSLIMIGCGEGGASKRASGPTTHIEVLDKADALPATITDGDTIKLTFDGELKTIRLIGIDTFESRKNNKAYRQAYEHHITIEEVVERGKKAKRYLEAKLSKRVHFYAQYDEEFLDRYDRTLAYIWLSDSDMINMDIICDGYAMPLTIQPNDTYAKEFQACYEEAKAAHIGVW